MNIRLKVNIIPEDKQVIVSIACKQCDTEAAGTVSGDMVTFNCPTHGNLGTAPIAQVEANLERARKDAGQRQGWGSPDFNSGMVWHRADEKPS